LLSAHIIPEDPYKAIRQACLVETNTDFEPSEDPIDIETPESPHAVASPTILPDSTPPSCHTEESEDSNTFAHHVPWSFGQSDRGDGFVKFRSPLEGEDTDKEEGHGLDDEGYGLDDEGHGLDDEGHGLDDNEGEKEAVPEGQQRAAPVMETAMGDPLGLAQVPSFQTLPSFLQQYPCCEDCGVLPKADHCQPLQYTVNHPIFNAHNDLLSSQTTLMEQMTQLTSMYEMLPVCYDDDDDEERSNSLKDNIISGLSSCVAIIPNEPVDSLSTGDEHIDTVSATESDEVIKSSVENLVPIPSESEGENGCDVPACFTSFSNILFDAKYDFYSSDNQPFFDEDFPKEIYSNPLFDEEIIPMKIDPHPFNAESDLIESMLNHDSSIIISSKIDSLLDEFASELTLLKSIPPGIDKTNCYTEEETYFTKILLYDNSSPRPSEEFVSDNSDADIESFSPYPIPIKDSDSLMVEIDLSFTPNDPMSPDIEDDDYDSERDILILE
nr:hypothetical protein [Tanacetum cinerariifolium]